VWNKIICLFRIKYKFQIKNPNIVFSFNTALYLLNKTERTPDELDITTTRNNSLGYCKDIANIHRVNNMIKNYKSLMDRERNTANKNNITVNKVLQNYMFGRILERLSISKYKYNFILKGGLLLSSINIDDNVTFCYIWRNKSKLNIDIANGDVITPREIEYNYKMLLEDRTL